MRWTRATALLTVLPFAVSAADINPEGFAGVPWLTSPERTSTILGVKLKDNCEGAKLPALLVAQITGCYSFNARFAGVPMDISLSFNSRRELTSAVMGFSVPHTREQALDDCAVLQAQLRREFGFGEMQSDSGMHLKYDNANLHVKWQTATSERSLQCVVDLRKDSGWLTVAQHYRDNKK